MHITVISFDEITRNLSQAFHLTEEAIQLLKQYNQDLVLDYYDLLQEVIDESSISRLAKAEKMFFSFSSFAEVLPSSITNIFVQLHTLAIAKSTSVPVIYLISHQDYPYLPNLVSLLEQTFNRPVTLLKNKRDLAKNFLPLEYETSSNS
ncbi:MAG: hypothetical protein HY817_05845 [Candidatus Abawacabacteria bacterium]|nr:hypothetical protein [Candidatus Abawacabacteria bacterium]